MSQREPGIFLDRFREIRERPLDGTVVSLVPQGQINRLPPADGC
jgi:hypothetical protein